MAFSEKANQNSFHEIQGALVGAQSQVMCVEADLYLPSSVSTDTASLSKVALSTSLLTTLMK